MSAIDKLIKFMRGLEDDHNPEGWPAVRMQQITMLLNEIEALRQERDRLRADAVRYRWLRSKNVGPSQIEKVSDDCNPPYFTLKCEGELDAAIDTAMAKEQGDEQIQY